MNDKYEGSKSYEYPFTAASQRDSETVESLSQSQQIKGVYALRSTDKPLEPCFIDFL